MKKYYIFENVDVMEIGKPCSGWKYYRNIIMPSEETPGAYERTYMDYIIDRNGNRSKEPIRIIHTRKEPMLDGEYETYQEAFEALNEFWDAYLCSCNK